MEYFVTGGTGFIGSHLVEELLADGHDVIVLTRSRSNAAELPDEVRVVEGDITEKESMREVMQGVDGVFHLAAWFQVGPGPWNAEKVERINVEGTRNVLELMDELDVPKGVYASTIGVYGNTGGRRVNESYESPNSFPTVYQRTKWRAHYEIAEPMIEDGLPLVITTLGAIYGPRDKDYGGTPRSALTDYLDGDLPMLPDDFVLPLDYVEDTARNIRKAMAEGDPGEEYIVAGEPENLLEIFAVAQDLTGVAAPRAVPSTLFRFLSYPVSAIERFTRPPAGFESETLRFFDTGAVLVDNSKARRELDIEHRSLEQGVREYLEWELEQLDSEITLDADRPTESQVDTPA
jgi:dihydroflavonol-4-reductase